MSRIEVNGLVIKLPDNIKVANGEITRADEVTQQRTLDEAEVERLVKPGGISPVVNPLDPASLPAAQVALLERAAKSEKKWPRLFFYSVFALMPAACMEVQFISEARAERISWLYPALLGLGVLLAALQIVLVLTEKRTT